MSHLATTVKALDALCTDHRVVNHVTRAAWPSCNAVVHLAGGTMLALLGARSDALDDLCACPPGSATLRHAALPGQLVVLCMQGPAGAFCVASEDAVLLTDVACALHRVKEPVP